MPPSLSIPVRSAPYCVTTSSPSELSEKVGLNKKSLVVFQDLDGKQSLQANGGYRLSTTVAKLVIHDVSDLTISVSTAVVTTIEIHNATNLTLNLGDDSAQAADSLIAAPGYGTLTLDPHLENVIVTYQRAGLVGAIVVSHPSAAAEHRKLSNVKVGIMDGQVYELDKATDSEGEGHGMPQSHLFYKDGWQLRGLERREKEYPSLKH